MSAPTQLSRRDFLRASAAAGAGLTLIVTATGCRTAGTASAAGGAAFEPNAFLRVGTDNGVTVIAKHMEMGQGSHTGLATILAEELDADWGQVTVVGAPGDASKYGNAMFGGVQGTGGSTAMANSFEQMREAGATARAMLVNAAAAEWSVPAAEITVAGGVVTHAGRGKRATFGELAEAAAKQPVPAEVPLKPRGEWKLIGNATLPRADLTAKINGTATFTQDVRRPGTLTAVVARPPRFGATVKSFDAARAKAVPGVKEVVQVPTGVAVLADTFWAAKQGRDALVVEWDESQAETRGTAEMRAELERLVGTPGTVAKSAGDAAGAFGGAARTVEATFHAPYLAHAAMEPMNCVVEIGKGGCELWYGAQIHTADQFAVSQMLGIKPEQVKINSLYAGGGFGRRAAGNADYVREAVSIAQAIGGKAPVKMVWTREDDMRAGNFRPIVAHRVRAALGADGKPVAWEHRVACQSILLGTPFAPPDAKVDPAAVEGIENLAYAVPNLQVEAHRADFKVPVLWWRSVGHTHTAFAVECFVDELAHAARKDPVQYRLDLYANSPRHAAVLKLAAEKAAWGTPIPKGRARGVAVHESFGTVVAEVAEVSRRADGTIKVERVVAAVDCGTVINPDIVKAQVESAVAYGLAAALHGEITLEQGRVTQGNFDGYRVLRLNEMPEVEVHILPLETAPSGIGEPGLPPIAPAVANAVFALTGKRVRELPMRG